MNQNRAELVRQLKNLLTSWPQQMLHDIRVQSAHRDALMEDAERAGAPDGTRVGIWMLWTDAGNDRRWFFVGVDI